MNVRILVEGPRVQQVGYRMFLLERALKTGIERIYSVNLNKDRIEILINDSEEKIDKFYALIREEKPEKAIVNSIHKEKYEDDMEIPTIDRYLQFLTLEQLSTGREEVLRLPDSIDRTMGTVAGSLSGIDGKLGDLIERFGIFGEYAKGMDGQLKQMNEKLGKISDLPKKIDSLPEGIAKALSEKK